MADDSTRSVVARTVGTAALIVLVLGVLPIAWEADAPWRVFGLLVAAGYAVHAARVVWREAFSTAPRPPRPATGARPHLRPDPDAQQPRSA
jgi:hypothetical protein